MASSDLIRWGGLAALLAGVLWIVLGLVSLAITRPVAGPAFQGTFSYYLVEVIFSLACIGMLGGLVGLHIVQARGLGRLGTVGFNLAFTGTALIVISTVTTLLLGRAVLGILFVVGMLGTLVGFALLGGATLRARVLPQWCGIVLLVSVLGFPVYFVFDVYGGGIVFGVIWLALGYALLSNRGQAGGEQPSRVS